MNADYIAGLEEAYRLMTLNYEIDLAPGRILNRIKQMKSTPDTTEPDRTGMSREQLESALAQREDQLRQAEAQCAEMREALERVWEVEEMGYTPDDPESESGVCVCDKCEGIQHHNHKSHSENCPQPIIEAALSTDCGKSILAQCAGMRDLLKVEGCIDPNCGGKGWHSAAAEGPHGDPIEEQVQCQWCFEKSLALSTDCGKSILGRLEEARCLINDVTATAQGEAWFKRRDDFNKGHTPTGQSTLERLEEARWLLDSTIGHMWNSPKDWLNRRDSWLSGHTPAT